MTLLGAHPRDRVDERPGVRVPRVPEELVGVGDLDDPAEVHDGDPVAEVLHDGEVVRDEQDAQAELARSGAKSSRIVACTDTSSAETGSSAMSTSGRTARARAMARRCRWPPENWLG